MRYIRSLWIAIDQLGNAIFGGWPDETISCRAWRWHITGRASWPCRLINFLFRDKQHCHDAWLAEARGSQLPRDIRLARTRRR